MSKKKIFTLIINKERLESLTEIAGKKILNFFKFNGHSYELLSKKFFKEVSKNNKKLYNTVFKEVYKSSVSEKSFMSYFFQLNTILNLPKSEVENILEIGGGQGVLKSLLNNYNYNHHSLDINKNYNPDIVGDVLKMNVKKNYYDMVCAFQVIEHLPSKYTEQIFKELARVTKKYIFISLPIQINSLKFNFNLDIKDRYTNRLSLRFNYEKLFQGFNIPDRDEQEFLKREDKSNPHYFEVGTKNYKKDKIIKMISKNNLNIVSDFHNHYYPYHWFILIEK